MSHISRSPDGFAVRATTEEALREAMFDRNAWMQSDARKQWLLNDSADQFIQRMRGQLQ